MLVSGRIKKIGAHSFVTPKKLFLGLGLMVLDDRSQTTLMATENLKRKMKHLVPQEVQELFISNNMYCFPTVCQAEHSNNVNRSKKNKQRMYNVTQSFQS